MQPPFAHHARLVVVQEDMVGPFGVRRSGAGSGSSRTSPPQTNSEMLRGPFSGQVMIFIDPVSSVADRGRALLADLR